MKNMQISFNIKNYKDFIFQKNHHFKLSGEYFGKTIAILKYLMNVLNHIRVFSSFKVENLSYFIYKEMF